jgi:hypothetical protein
MASTSNYFPAKHSMFSYAQFFTFHTFFFRLLREEPAPDVPARKELNYKNLLAPTECITTISKCFSNPAIISFVEFWDCDDIQDYNFPEIFYLFLVVLD